MALIIRRDCGMGADHKNYVFISLVNFHIELNQAYNPLYLWKIDVACYLNKETREIERLQSVEIDESKLKEDKVKKYREVKSRKIIPVTTMYIELAAKDFKLEGVSSKDSLFSFFYNEMKKRHAGAFGVTSADIEDDIKEEPIEDLVEKTYGSID